MYSTDGLPKASSICHYLEEQIGVPLSIDGPRWNWPLTLHIHLWQYLASSPQFLSGCSNTAARSVRWALQWAIFLSPAGTTKYNLHWTPCDITLTIESPFDSQDSFWPSAWAQQCSSHLLMALCVLPARPVLIVSVKGVRVMLLKNDRCSSQWTGS